MNRLRRYGWSALVGLLVSALPACATPFGLFGPALEGRVIDARTEQPLPNVWVAVLWHGSLFAFVESQTVCVHVETTTTDQDGHYRFTPWHAAADIGWVRDIGPTVYAYRAGYERVLRDTPDNTIYLKPFTGGAGGAVDGDLVVGDECGSAGASEKNLIPLSRALYEDAKSLAQSKEDNKIVNALLYELEKRELGYEAATKRMLERNGH